MFVVLEHDTTRAAGLPPDQRGLHWDLLIEVPGGERLPTWRLARNPLDAADETPAQRLADHRRFYLDHEGEVAGDRGTVRRLDRGSATVEHCTEDRVVMVLAGEHLRGRFEIVREAAGTAVFRRVRP